MTAAVRDMGLNRHDMLFLSSSGRKSALNSAVNTRGEKLSPAEWKIFEELVLNPSVPAIVRRQELVRENEVEVGFSSPQYLNGTRARFACVLPFWGISRVTTPFDAASTTDDAALRELIKCGCDNGLAVGIFGSLALEILTGLAYFTKTSDYDIVVKRNAKSCDLKRFFESLTKLERDLGIKIDAEILDVSGYGVKLKELFASGKTVLCKGLHDIKLANVPEFFNNFIAN